MLAFAGKHCETNVKDKSKNHLYLPQDGRKRGRTRSEDISEQVKKQEN